MTGETEAPDFSATGTTVSEVLRAMGRLMRDCHRECLELQEAISRAGPSARPDARDSPVYQNLDHMTQVHEDLARLLPQLAGAIETGVGPVDGLAEALRLISLRHRLFGYDEGAAASVSDPGEVSLF